MNDALKAFVEYLTYNRHLSAHSVRAYTSDVEQYLASVASARGTKLPALTPAHLDAESVRAFLVGLNKAAQARTSVARKLSGVRAFLHYLRREGWSTTTRRPLPWRRSCDQTIPLHLSETGNGATARDAERLTPLGRRDRAMLELFYASGLRLSELVGVDLEDLDLSARMVRVLGKGGKERLCRSTRAADAHSRTWLPDRAVLGSAGDGRGARRPQAKAVRQCRSRPGEAQAPTGRGRSAPTRAGVRERPRRPPDRPKCPPAGAALRRPVQRAPGHQPARAAPLVRDAPAAARRRPARPSRNCSATRGSARPSATRTSTRLSSSRCTKGASTSQN